MMSESLEPQGLLGCLRLGRLQPMDLTALSQPPLLQLTIKPFILGLWKTRLRVSLMPLQPKCASRD